MSVIGIILALAFLPQILYGITLVVCGALTCIGLALAAPFLLVKQLCEKLYTGLTIIEKKCEKETFLALYATAKRKARAGTTGDYIVLVLFLTLACSAFVRLL